MLNKKVEAAINHQINRELYSSYLYLSMSAYFESKDLKGFANWLRIQAQEEMVHVMKFFDYVNEKGGRVSLGALEAPPTEWDSPVAVAQAILDHEESVTALINDLMALAISEHDYASHTMLQWFVSEQVEEEASASDLLAKTKMVADAPGGFYLLDQELVKRVFTAPAQAGGA